MHVALVSNCWLFTLSISLFFVNTSQKSSYYVKLSLSLHPSHLSTPHLSLEKPCTLIQTIHSFTAAGPKPPATHSPKTPQIPPRQPSYNPPHKQPSAHPHPPTYPVPSPSLPSPLAPQTVYLSLPSPSPCQDAVPAPM